MAIEELARTCGNLRKDGLDFALLTSHENIAYVSGFDQPLPIGSQTDAAHGMPLALVLINAREENAVLVTVDGYKEQAAQESRLPGALAFSTADPSGDPARSLARCVRDALRGIGLRDAAARIGVERETFPVVLAEMLQDDFPATALSSCRPALERARMTKTEREVALLREVARITDAGQEALVKAARELTEGTELDVWARVYTRIMEEARKTVPVPLIGELVTGPRTGVVNYPGGPRMRRISAGDTGIMDISVRVDGYWSDCCNTVVFGREPTREQKSYFDAARDGFEAALDTVRPGVRCCDIEAAVQKAFATHGFPPNHYCGHQIGAAVNEEPHIVPADQTVVEAGMVFCFEPGEYAGPKGTTGARLERMVYVAASGNEVLNKFPWGMD